ncbi:MAG TPA: hypothetical protein VIP77_15900 [Jiangellaceae bacterium]
MIAHVPGYLCAADVALALGVDPKAVHRLAHRHFWRRRKRTGHREVYYCAEDIMATRVKDA